MFQDKRVNYYWPRFTLPSLSYFPWIKMSSVSSQGKRPSHTLTNPGPGASLAQCVRLSGGGKSGRCHPFLVSVTSHHSVGQLESSFAPLLFTFEKTHQLLCSLLRSSANATPEFEGRGGDDLGTEIANTLYRIFNNKSSVDLKSLCISPREHCWILYVDVMVTITFRCRWRPVGLLSSQGFPLSNRDFQLPRKD